MTVTTYEGVVEKGKIRLRTGILLPEKTKVFVIVPDGKVHPAMAAYGLWKDNPEMENLAKEIREEREKYTPRPEVICENP
jgi:hypothetical protein